MHTETGLRKGTELTRVISVLLIVACVVTLFSPWVHIGLRKSGGGMLDVNTLLDQFGGISIDAFMEQLMDTDISDIIYDDVVPKSAQKDFSKMQKAVSKIANVMKDSKLSPVETATVCTKILDVQSFVKHYGDDDSMDVAAMVALISAIILWGMIVAFIALSVYGVFAVLTNRKNPLIPMLFVYYLLFAIFLILSVVVNLKMEEELGNAFILGMIGAKSPSVLHIKLAPILGFVLMTANFAITKLCPAGMRTAGEMKLANSGNPGKKRMWKCACGAANPSTSKFCPKCGMMQPIFETADGKSEPFAVPEPVVPCAPAAAPETPTYAEPAVPCAPAAAPETPVYAEPAVPTAPPATPETPVSAEPPEAFVPPIAYVSPVDPTVAHCRMCGRPVAEEGTLCGECRARN